MTYIVTHSLLPTFSDDLTGKLVVEYQKDWKKFPPPDPTPAPTFPIDHLLLSNRDEPEADFEYLTHLND